MNMKTENKIYGLVLENNHFECKRLIRMLNDDRIAEAFPAFYTHIRPDVISALPAERLHFPSLVLFGEAINPSSFELVATGYDDVLSQIRDIIGQSGYGKNKELLKGDEEE